MLTGIGSLPRFLHGGYFGARGIKTSRGRASAVSSAGNSSFPNSPPRLMLNQTLRREGWRVPSRSVQSGRARGCPRPIRSSQMPPAPRQTRMGEKTGSGSLALVIPSPRSLLPPPPFTFHLLSLRPPRMGPQEILNTAGGKEISHSNHTSHFPWN
ncbi:unnamed protein product [Nyctereutes procyonoides]|uniref:(raccoon dog) hypothetical protein n=1 Tax=Nyctereutes procyonoides TaxID=34880 RepID=A0A811YHI6_NYCPR|nr:unnamed protein product [Nyctereutes procyonoides]